MESRVPTDGIPSRKDVRCYNRITSVYRLTMHATGVMLFTGFRNGCHGDTTHMCCGPYDGSSLS